MKALDAQFWREKAVSQHAHGCPPRNRAASTTATPPIHSGFVAAAGSRDSRDPAGRFLFKLDTTLRLRQFLPFTTQCEPGGNLRRSSSKKLKMKLTLFTAEFCSVPEVFSTAKRLPSGCRSKAEVPSPGSLNWPGDQSWGL